MKIKSVFILFFFLSSSVQTLRSQNTDTSEITVRELESHLAFLASDSLMGRKPGTDGGLKAAQYIRDQFESNRLELLGEDGFQYFDVITSIKAGENNRFEVGSFQGKIVEDYTPLSFSGNSSESASVVFAGYGFDFDLDSASWHDYENLDVSGKFVIVLIGSPDDQNPIYREYETLREKVLVAKDKGACGVLFVSGIKTGEKDELIDLYYDKSQSHTGILVLHLKRSVIDLILEDTGHTIEALEDKLISFLRPNSFALDKTVTCTVDLIKEKAQTQNVMALLKSNNPQFGEEFIVLGAHYDHLGMGGPGSGSRRPDTLAVHNGADDNASGVASILEIAEKLAFHLDNLKRSVLFVAFGAEEMGVVGSKYFTDHPLVNFDKIKSMINLDMVGRLDTLTNTLSIGGTATAIDFEKIINYHLEANGLAAAFSTQGFGPSDHAAFYVKEIPVLSVMTGIHLDYHTPFDDVEKINFDGQKKISDFVYTLICDLAKREDTLVYQEAGPKSMSDARHRFKVTLGIMPDVAASDVAGLRVIAPMPDRPAFKAGMEKGDVIVAIDGQPVGDIYEYMHRLSELKSGQIITVDVLRGEEKKVLIVQL